VRWRGSGRVRVGEGKNKYSFKKVECEKKERNHSSFIIRE